MTRLSVVLRRVYAELLRVHASTVVTLGQFRSDRERMGGALVEARNHHEALGLVRDAAAALAAAVRRLGGRPEETVSCKQILWRIE